MQVHPAKLTHALMAAAQEAANAQLVIGTVAAITTHDGAITGVRVQQQDGQEVELPADAVVLAMGPWTDAARAWLPTAPHTSGRMQQAPAATCTESLQLLPDMRTAQHAQQL